MPESKVSTALAVAKALYKDEFTREFVRNLALFGVGVWLAREFSSVEIMAPQPV